MVVIRIGRNRSMQALRIASSGFSRSVRSATSAKSTSMMPFFFTMPISSTMPISAISENSKPARCSTPSAPTPADGSVDRIVSGWMKLS